MYPICASIIFLLLFFWNSSVAQVLPSHRIYQWELAGLRGASFNHVDSLSVSDFGADNTGATPVDSVVQLCIGNLAVTGGVLYFPPGDYLFNEPVYLTDGIIFRGESASSTHLTFELTADASAINVQGAIDSISHALVGGYSKGDVTISHAGTGSFSPGDRLLIWDNDTSRIFSAWAANTTGQIVTVQSVAGTDLTLTSELRRDYYAADSLRITKLFTIENVGVERLSITRLDTTPSTRSNVFFWYAANCYVRCIESYFTNFSHVSMRTSTNIEVKGNYFQESLDYGGGGNGYGVTLYYTSGECLIENNVFKLLRHSMLIQAGANGNVLGYNYSRQPFWTGTTLPDSSAGDLVLHGNWPYANLMEGNLVQHIVVDASHDANGHHNTFFRNRAAGYGMDMDFSAVTDSTNFIGNEITNTQILHGLYILNGDGNFVYGNNHKGTIKPTGTDVLPDTSYYLPCAGTFYSDQSEANWISFGPPSNTNDASILAHDRYQANNLTTCNEVNCITSDVADLRLEGRFNVYPNPTNGLLHIEAKNQIVDVSVFDLSGKLQLHFSSAVNLLDLGGLEQGIYLLVVTDQAGFASVVRVIRTH